MASSLAQRAISASSDQMLAVILVNYRTSDMTIRCVGSILEQGIATVDRIVVVDNNSRDGSVDSIRSAFPKLRVIALETNCGFGAGVNVGLRWLHNEQFVLVLNPDTYFEDNSVAVVISYLKGHPDVGIAGLDLVYKDGSRQYSARRFYSLLDVAARRIGIIGRLLKKRIDRHIMKDAWQTCVPFDAEWIMGTGFVARRDVITALGGMDEILLFIHGGCRLVRPCLERGFSRRLYSRGTTCARSPEGERYKSFKICSTPTYSQPAQICF